MLQVQALSVHLLHRLEMLLAEGLVHINELVILIALDFWYQGIGR